MTRRAGLNLSPSLLDCSLSGSHREPTRRYLSYLSVEIRFYAFIQRNQIRCIAANFTKFLTLLDEIPQKKLAAFDTADLLRRRLSLEEPVAVPLPLASNRGAAA